MLRRSLFKTATAAAAAGTVGATASCGSESKKSSDGESQSDITLRMIMWTSNPKHLKLFNSIADDFIKKTPEVSKVKYDSVTVPTLDTTLTTQLGSDDPPDLSWLPVERSPEYIHAGALQNVKKVLQDTPGYDLDDLLPNLQKSWQTDDAIYGVPFSSSAYLMYYNADLFKAAGVDNPNKMIEKGTWDWKHFRRAVKTISDTQKVTGFVMNDFDYKVWNRLLPIMYAFGARPWNEADTTCTMSTPEMAAAMGLFHDMVYQDHSVPEPGQQADFWGGQAGASSAFLSSNGLLADAKFKWGVVPMPSGPGGNKQVMGQSAIVAYKASHHAQAAAKYLAFLTNKENSKKLAEFFPPSRDSLLTPSVLASASPLLSKDQLTPIVEAARKYGIIRPTTKNSSRVEDTLNSAMNQYLWKPNANIPEGLKQVCSTIQPLLEQQ